MTLQGETLATGAPTVCPDCGDTVTAKVYASAAGYYVGTWCQCGPYTRESGYYRHRSDAERDLDDGTYFRP